MFIRICGKMCPICVKKISLHVHVQYIACLSIVHALYCLLIEVAIFVTKKGLHCCLLIGRHAERRPLPLFGFLDVRARGSSGVGWEIYTNPSRAHISVLRDALCPHTGKPSEWRVVTLKEDVQKNAIFLTLNVHVCVLYQYKPGAYKKKLHISYKKVA